MNAIKYAVEHELQACEICMEEIPADEANNEEGADYVIHYYGLECYVQWKNQHYKEES